MHFVSCGRTRLVWGEQREVMDRFAGMDARLSTSEVVRVVGVNRSTLFRWCKKGAFPQKHISGGWLRSDIERWFAIKAEQNP